MASKSINYHILPVAATMVGVCMTVISLVQLVPKSAISSWVDEILAVDALIFLVSAWLSFWTILKVNKTADKNAYNKNAQNDEDKSELHEKIADWLFLTGLTIVGFVSVLIAFDLFLNK